MQNFLTAPRAMSRRLTSAYGTVSTERSDRGELRGGPAFRPQLLQALFRTSRLAKDEGLGTGLSRIERGLPVGSPSRRGSRPSAFRLGGQSRRLAPSA